MIEKIFGLPLNFCLPRGDIGGRHSASVFPDRRCAPEPHRSPAKGELKQPAAGGCLESSPGQGKSGYPVGPLCVLTGPLPPLSMRIPLLTPEGAHIEWLTEDQARDMLRRGQARFVRRKGTIRALILGCRPSAEIIPISEGRSRPARYSHDREVAETYLDDQGRLRRRHPLDANPRGCWTLRRIDGSLRRIYVTSVTDCMDDAA